MRAAWVLLQAQCRSCSSQSLCRCLGRYWDGTSKSKEKKTNTSTFLAGSYPGETRNGTKRVTDRRNGIDGAR